MGIKSATWKEIAQDSAGGIRDKVDTVMQLYEMIFCLLWL